MTDQLTAKEQVIFDAYNDPQQGFISASRLFRKLREEHPGMGTKTSERSE